MSLVVDVFESTPLPPGTRSQLFGMEIELEMGSPANTEVRLPNWQVVSDGSLRNYGLEMISDGPKTLNTSLDMLVAAGDVITRSQPSNRCSFHVHVDARRWTIEELCNVLRTYMVFEDVFYDNSGNRGGSQFCVPVVGSRIESAWRDFLRTQNPHMFPGFDGLKYAGLNVGHLRDFGSIEFRHHRGLTSGTEGIEWLSALNVFCMNARGITRNQLRDAVATDPVAFARSLFPPQFSIREDNLLYILNFKATELR